MVDCAAMLQARLQPRVCIIGLDSVPPALLFHKFWPQLPNLRRLICEGGAGILQSCDPPITVPAWATMFTGHDPGALGLYGFHDRVDHAYDARRLASSWSYARPPLWDILSRAGLRSYVLGVPHTYPPKPLMGRLVTGMLTPPDVGVATYPAHLAPSVQRRLGVHSLDVDDFRYTPLPALVAHAKAASAGLFGLATQWAVRGDWTLLTLVDMGPDRLQHALWHHAFAEHPRHAPGHPLQGALLAYYVHLDRLVGELQKQLREDDLLLIVSDHGACAMGGAVALNTWLMQHGYLRLRTQPQAPEPLRPQDVDWPNTRAWADGGYVGRIYVNQKGREPQGVVPKEQSDALIAHLCASLAASLPSPPQPHRFVRPREAYSEVRGCAPDLLVYLAGLRWRALGTVGWDNVMVEGNDRGPDGANHDSHGVIAMHGPQAPALAPRQSIYDVAPTVLQHVGLPVPKSMRGVAIGSVPEACQAALDIAT